MDSQSSMAGKGQTLNCLWGLTPVLLLTSSVVCMVLPQHPPRDSSCCNSLGLCRRFKG